MRGLANVYIRSPRKVEVAPGVFDYQHKVYNNVRVRITSRVVNYTAESNGTTIPKQTIRQVVNFTIPMRMDPLMTQVEYVEYRGILYEVETAELYPPRINATLGDVANISKDELYIEGA